MDPSSGIYCAFWEETLTKRDDDYYEAPRLVGVDGQGLELWDAESAHNEGPSFPKVLVYFWANHPTVS